MEPRKTRRALPLLLVLTAVATAGAQEDDRLAPLRFLEGVWHGEGQGPYGAYEFETTVVRRGRWLLLKSDVFPPGGDALLFVSTQVYGYDGGGLVLHLFDTAGDFLFRGEATGSGARFAWSRAESWKRVEYTRRDDGTLHSRYDAFEPSLFPEPVAFVGVWRPGARPRPAAR